jgi:3-oxoacyl-[acyl-carrier protein] reductase
MEDDMDLELAGKVFIVTGGTDGLGLATAHALLGEGAKVLVTGRSESKFTDLCIGLGAGVDRLAYSKGDNSDPGLPDQLRAAVMERWGRLDGMLISVGGPPPGKFLATDDEMWRAAFESVFLGAVRLMRDLAPAITDGGAIAIVLAISAKEASSSITISNGLRPGLAMLVKSLAEELGPRSIRVNALLPNIFATDRMKRLLNGREPPMQAIALGRIGEPAEFGRIATVLLSPVASYITGAAISIDGGQLKSL